MRINLSKSPKTIKTTPASLNENSGSPGTQ
jgi:hypothetical protein